MALLLWLTLACTGAQPDSAASCVGEDHVTWNNWGEGFFNTYCRSCHSVTSPDRNDAPDAVNFDTLDEVEAQKASIQQTVLDAETMPIGGGVTDEDRQLLQEFLDCGLP